MFLSLIVVAVVAIVVFRENKSKNVIKIFIFSNFLVLLFNFENVMKWVLQINISLQNLVTLDVKLVSLKRSNPIIIHDLLILHQYFIFFGVMKYQIIDHDSFHETAH